MKKVYTFILSGAAILAVVACNKEVQVEDNSQNNEPVYETLSVKVGAETKVSLGTGDTKSVFEENDQIAVYTPGGFQTCLVDGEGKISVDISDGARSNYAVYYNGAILPSYSAGTLSIILPATYDYADVVGNKNPVPMVAMNASGDPADMTFYAVGTLFRVTVKAIPADATSLVFQFPGNKVNGTFTVTNPGNSNPSISTKAPETGEDKITINLPDAPHATEMVLNIPLPTGDYDDVFITPVGSKTKVTAVRHIKAGGYYNATRAKGKILTATMVSFSVSAEDKVVFSPGNLQYTKSTSKFSFINPQYSTVETLGQDVGSNYSAQDVVSLFGWATSGLVAQPYLTDNTYGPAYGPAIKVDDSQWYDEGGSYNWDWGHYNAIGSYSAGFWRTLTAGSTGGEWGYLLNTRDGNRYAKATVNGMAGLIVFPDVYDHPSGLAAISNANIADAAFSSNTYSADKWAQIEAAGAIFLTTSGYRNLGSVVSNTGSIGMYWSSTVSSGSYAYHLRIRDSAVAVGTQGRWRGYSVRLVRDL